MTTATPAPTPAIADLLLEAINFLAEYNGQPVVVESAADGRALVSGYFGQAWTHGGWAPVTSTTVPVAALANVRAVLPDGTEVTPAQYKAMVAGEGNSTL